MESINKSDNNFEQCLKCTICTVYCPVLAVNPQFPGPKHGGPDQERLRLKMPSFYDEANKYCMNCKRCEVACPSNVRIGDIIQKAKLKYSRHRPSVRDFFLSHTDLVGTLSSPFAPLVNKALGWNVTKQILDGVLKVDRHRTFPKYSHEKFTSWMKKHADEQKQYPHQLCYFHGCYVNYNFPDLGKDLVRIMNAFGYGVELLEEEKCCGVALISNGFVGQARKQAETNLKSIRKAVSQEKAVILTSSTCAMTLRDEYPHVLNLDNKDVRDHIEIATRFIYRMIHETKAFDVSKLKFRNRPLKIAYHTPCHLEKLGWEYYSLELLRLIPNINLTVLKPNCCGIGGTYGFKKENYENAQKIGAPLFKEIEEGDFDFIVSDCETCKWQIEMSTSKKCIHPISVFAQALD
ncbi:MAG: anaerobic glycerol-3-phosphate dehydrogenase subunit C [Bacteroidales bacterium]|nr:anaerobic glycerol-3-phosphate dehydrogenase subunit C [Bacteroidales bacterium]